MEFRKAKARIDTYYNTTNVLKYLFIHDIDSDDKTYHIFYLLRD